MTGSPAIAALIEMLRGQDASLPLPDADGLDEAEARRLAVWMLNDAAPWPAPAAALLGAIADLHAADAAADDPVWRRLRGQAVLLADHEDPAVRDAGAVGEAAAWPLTKARACLCEIYRAVLTIRLARAAAATGWTRDDEERAHGIMRRISAGYGVTRPDRTEIPALFAAADPELERRFSAQLDASNRTPRAYRLDLSKRLDVQAATS